jgi:TonB family protein
MRRRFSNGLALGAALMVLCAVPLVPRVVHAADTMPPPQTPATAAQVRVDGLYHSRDPQGRGDGFLRFYPDGTAVSASSTGSPIDVLKWLGPDHEHISKGPYSVTGDRLAFASTSPSGRVDYDGTIAGTTLDLQLTSRINGHQSRRRYVFIPDASSTFGPTDPVPVDMSPAAYPKDALDSEGTVRLQVDISASGAVTSAMLEKSSGVDALDTAALDAARKWTFRPARDAQGQPVAARMRMPMTFKPRGSMGANIRALMATACSQVNEEVARLDPATAGKSAGASIDRAIGLVMVKQTSPGLAVLPEFGDVPSLPDGTLVAFVGNLTGTVEGIKSRCAAQPDAAFGDVLRQQIQALTPSSRRKQ